MRFANSMEIRATPEAVFPWIDDPERYGRGDCENRGGGAEWGRSPVVGGVDPYVAPATREIAWFVVRVPRTEYPTAKLKITLNLAAVSGWKEIDAVQLIGRP